MRYYLDTEFDGHNGPLISVALVREDGRSVYVVTNAEVTDPWVREHVVPVLGDHDASDFIAYGQEQNAVGGWLRIFLNDDWGRVTIIADSVVDVGRFCTALSTGPDGGWESFPGLIDFEVYDVTPYPTTLRGAKQHNSWWDAMALRELERSEPQVFARLHSR